MCCAQVDVWQLLTAVKLVASVVWQWLFFVALAENTVNNGDGYGSTAIQ
jgi:hypothetical protein